MRFPPLYRHLFRFSYVSLSLSLWVTLVASLPTRLPDFSKGLKLSFHALAVLMHGEWDLRKANDTLATALAIHEQ
jgi:hypothetical protein